MKRQLLSFAAAASIAVTALVPAGVSASVRTDTQKTTCGNGSININLYTTYLEVDVPDMVNAFFEANPSLKSKYKVTTYVTDVANNRYETLLNAKLSAGNADAPDIYVADSDCLLNYTKGDMASYAAPYSSFISNFSTKLSSAEIMQYSQDMGKAANGNIVAMCFLSTPGVMFYNTTIAKKTFGTDDPSKISSIVGGGSGSWSKFLSASGKLKEKGYYSVSNIYDLWNVCEKSATTPWVTNGKASVDPARSEYLDLARKFCQNGWCYADHTEWSSEWYSDMANNKVFAFFGSAWIYNYVMRNHITTTWKACPSPVGFWWSGNWFMANKTSIKNADKKAFIAKFLEWVTLDTSTSGLQYQAASASTNMLAYKDTVTSMAVLKKTNGVIDSEGMGGQDTYPVFIAAGKSATGTSKCIYDMYLNSIWESLAKDYARGKIDREAVYRGFKDGCLECGIDPSGIRTTPEPISGLRAVSAGKNRVRISWNQDKNADGYLIYGKKNNKYSYLGMTTSAKSTSYVDTAALVDDYNYYWVFPYFKDASGKIHAGMCDKYVYAKGFCPAVTNLKANGTAGKVTLTWTASEGAEGYLIYGIRPGGKYGYIGMASGTAFPDTKASKTDWTFYWVFPYHKDGSKMVVGGTAKYVYSKAR